MTETVIKKKNRPKAVLSFMLGYLLSLPIACS